MKTEMGVITMMYMYLKYDSEYLQVHGLTP